MTGLDLSPVSVERARRLSRECGTPVEYVVADVEDASAALGGRTFDLVYVSMGALCWLPSIRRWAAAVAACLRPGGRVFVRDVHPMCGALRGVRATTDAPARLEVAHPYVETPQPQVWDEAETYVATADGAPPPITHTVTHAWNHGLGETVQALLDEGVRLDRLEEHDSVPFCPFPGQMEPVDPADPDGHGEWRLSEGPERAALSFTLVGTLVGPDR